MAFPEHQGYGFCIKRSIFGSFYTRTRVYGLDHIRFSYLSAESHAQVVRGAGKSTDE